MPHFRNPPYEIIASQTWHHSSSFHFTQCPSQDQQSNGNLAQSSLGRRHLSLLPLLPHFLTSPGWDAARCFSEVDSIRIHSFNSGHKLFSPVEDIQLNGQQGPIVSSHEHCLSQPYHGQVLAEARMQKSYAQLFPFATDHKGVWKLYFCWMETMELQAAQVWAPSLHPGFKFHFFKFFDFDGFHFSNLWEPFHIFQCAALAPAASHLSMEGVLQSSLLGEWFLATSTNQPTKEWEWARGIIWYQVPPSQKQTSLFFVWDRLYRCPSIELRELRLEFNMPSALKRQVHSNRTRRKL